MHKENKNAKHTTDNGNDFIADVSISFDMTKDQVDKLEEWKRGLPKKRFGAIDYGYTYCITPTGLGNTLIVKRADGFEINLTDYDMW